MDDLDRAILNVIQSHFPLVPRPYAEVARQVGSSETEVMERVRKLKERGIIRRIGGNVSSASVGYTSTLCAARVEPERLEEFVAAVNRRPGVTHNYQRGNDRFNVWFTLIAPSAEDLDAELDSLRDETGVDIVSLPAEKTFKIAVDFPV